MDHPAQRQQRCDRRTLSRLPRRQSELAQPDLPAPARRSRTLGRQARRHDRAELVRQRRAGVRQGAPGAGARAAVTRRPPQCRAAGSRGLARRCPLRRHRGDSPRPVRRTVERRRSQGADGLRAVRQ